MSRFAISVIIPAHNPDRERLRRTLLGLRSQSLATGWELIVVDNASTHFPSETFFREHGPAGISVIPEPQLGLSAARRRGLGAVQGEFAVLVDDDNVLAPDYLENVLAIFTREPRLGAIGGKSLPEFQSPPPTWAEEFFPLLALRDDGDSPRVSQGLRPPGATRDEYPLFAPIGAGMALRRAAWQAWTNTMPTAVSDRRGADLSSSGDNEIVLHVMGAGWEVGYFPELRLTHLIPAGRLNPDYLARLNRGIQQSWMRVLTAYDANPWPALTRGGARLRKLKAWLTYRPWSSVPARIRWQGACGHFDGRVARVPEVMSSSSTS